MAKVWSHTCSYYKDESSCFTCPFPDCVRVPPPDPERKRGVTGKGQERTERKPWTREEEAYLREEWGHTPIQQIADHLGRNVASVSTHVYRMRVYSKDPTMHALRDYKLWQDEDWIILEREIIQCGTVNTLAQKMGFSVSTVRNKMLERYGTSRLHVLQEQTGKYTEQCQKKCRVDEESAR